jgi:predicted permease
MAEEIRLHLELQTEQNLAAGMDPDEARYAALRKFGGVEQIKERCRDQRGWVWLELGWKEFGFAMRSLRRAPGFSLAVLTTLALCIGPNTAILSVLYTLVYKPLPFHEPHQLVSISNIAERMGGAKRPSSVAQYADFKAHADRFAGFGYFSATNATLGEEDLPVRAAGMLVSADLLPLLGVQIELGRFFSPDEQTAGKDHVVVLSHMAWEKRYNSDPNVIGREMRMDAQNYTIVGVASRSFEELFNDVEFFRPYTVWPNQPDVQARYAGSVRLVGRLKPGVSLEAGRAQLEVLEKTFYDSVATPQLRTALSKSGYHIGVSDAREELSEPIRAPLLLLQGGAALVLLIGCVNVASILLARLSAKRPELAIRHALGAGAATLLRQMLAESFLLVGLAGAIGVGAALAMLRFMNYYLPTVVRHVPPIALDTHVLGIVSAVVLAMILAMGVVPFAVLWRSGVRRGETPLASTGRNGRNAIGALVICQMAIALVLLVGSGLLIHSFARVMAVSPGFDAEHIVQGRVKLPMVRYKDPKDNIAIQQRLLTAMKEIPGVEAAGLSIDVPVNATFQAVPVVLRDDRPAAGGAQEQVYTNVVSPEFFATMGIRLRDGRLFRNDDELRTNPVVIVDETFAQRYFPGRNIVGQEMAFGNSPPPTGHPWIRIVGVVSRANLSGLEGRDGWPFVYLPFNQQPSQGFSLVVRSPRMEADVVAEMRAKVRAIDSTLPLYATGSLAGSLDAMLGNRRALMFLLSVFALLAIALAAVGLYGVLNYDVAQRTREIGIRGAIGATRGQIVAMILRQGLARALAGLIVGLAGAFFFTRLLKNMLFEISATDPVSYGGVALLLLVVALLASWLPARRAAKVDPIVALRCE